MVSTTHASKRRFPENTMLQSLRSIQRRTAIILFVVCAAVFAIGTGLAQDQVQREGYFEVRSATTEVRDGVHTLDARLQLVLSSEALAALESGVTLTIELQMQVIRVRRWIVDDAEAELAVRYELEYRPLSQRYIVKNLNSGEQDSFATLYSALNSLGRIQALPVIDDALLQSDREYRLRLRAMLNTRQYPCLLYTSPSPRDED